MATTNSGISIPVSSGGGGASVYTGTDTENTDYPIGTTLNAFAQESGATLNAHRTLAQTTTTYNCWQASSNPAPGIETVQLLGTWANRGFVGTAFSTPVYMFQRIL